MVNIKNSMRPARSRFLAVSYHNLVTETHHLRRQQASIGGNVTHRQDTATVVVFRPSPYLAAVKVVGR